MAYIEYKTGHETRGGKYIELIADFRRDYNNEPTDISWNYKKTGKRVGDRIYTFLNNLYMDKLYNKACEIE